MIGVAAGNKGPLLLFCAGVAFVEEFVQGPHGVALLRGLSGEVQTRGFSLSS